MATRQLPWLRLYVDTIHDPKLRRLPPAQRWVWIAVLVCARSSPVPGTLLVSVSETFQKQEVVALSVEDLADAAKVGVEEVSSALSAFERQDMIEMDEKTGAITVKHWSRRQFESDTSTERVRSHRERKRDWNDDETLHARSSNGAVTSPDTDVSDSGESVFTPAHASTHAREGDESCKALVLLERCIYERSRYSDEQWKTLREFWGHFDERLGDEIGDDIVENWMLKMHRYAPEIVAKACRTQLDEGGNFGPDYAKGIAKNLAAGFTGERPKRPQSQRRQSPQTHELPNLDDRPLPPPPDPEMQATVRAALLRQSEELMAAARAREEADGL